MLIYKTCVLKDKEECVIRTMVSGDARAMLEFKRKAAEETDNFISYPEENRTDETVQAEILDIAAQSPNSLYIGAFLDEKLVGMGMLLPLGAKQKIRHRSTLGIGVLKEYWSRGIASLLMKEMLKSAKKMGYIQVELEVMEENETAIHLYKKSGFEEFGRNENAFLLKDGQIKSSVLMRYCP